MELTISHEHVSELMTVVKPVGEISVYGAPFLRESIVEAINHGYSQVVIDLSKVDFLDSTACGVMVGALKRTRAHEGGVAIVCTDRRLLKILQSSGLIKVFPIYSTVSEAEVGLPLITQLFRRPRNTTQDGERSALLNQAPDGLECTHEPLSAVMSLITLQGGLDAVSVPRLRLTLHSLLDQGRHLLLIDLQAVVRMDGPGLGLLVGALKRARQTNGGIALVCTRAPLLEIFRITGLTRVFPCYESVAAAREGLLTVLDATPRAGQTAEATP